MSQDSVRKLIENATLFAKCYSKLVEALLAEGVPEDVARVEARNAATLAVVVDEKMDGKPWER